MAVVLRTDEEAADVARLGCLRERMMNVEPIFVFDDPPTLLIVYVSLDEARESLESLDVEERQAAFTASGQVIDVTPVDDLFAVSSSLIATI